MQKYQIGEIILDKVTEQKIIYPNKTRKFLLPCLHEYGATFINKLNNVFKVAVGLGDMIITKRYFIAPERHLFILIDSQIAKSYFISFLDWVRDQDMYEDDYVYGNLQKTTLHMVVIKFPQKYYDTFNTFKEGKYSEMFSDKETINKLFTNEKEDKNTIKILGKDRNYKIVFTEKLNHIFNTTITPQEWEGELELPPTEVEEIFNPHLKQ